MSPVVGMGVDYCGNRTALIVASPAMLLAAHLIMANALWNPYVPLVLVGLSYSIFAASIWPIIPLVVDSQLHGLAFGVMTSVQNLAQTVVPAIASIVMSSHDEPLIHHRQHGHAHQTKLPDTTSMLEIAKCELLFASLALTGLVCAAVLVYIDEYPEEGPGGLLRKTTKRTVDVLHAELEESQCTPPLHPPPPPIKEEVVGIAMLPRRGRTGSNASVASDDENTARSGSIGPLAMKLPPISESAAPVGALGNSPQFVAPWETPDSNISETSQLVSQDESKVDRAGKGGKYGSTSSRTRVLFTKYDVMDEGMTPLKKAVSFAGDMTFPERRPGQGQHPAIPLKRRNTTISTRMRLSHF